MSTIENDVQKTVIVNSRRRDAKTYYVRKYYNSEFPKNLYRKTSPDIDKLIPLARFIFENCTPNVAGFYPKSDRSQRVRVIDGRTEADLIRAEAKKGVMYAEGWRTTDTQRAINHAERMIACYGLDSKPAMINDWLFSVIEPEQTDEDYWNKEANDILVLNPESVKIGDKTFQL